MSPFDQLSPILSSIARATRWASGIAQAGLGASPGRLCTDGIWQVRTSAMMFCCKPIACWQASGPLSPPLEAIDTVIRSPLRLTLPSLKPREFS